MFRARDKWIRLSNRLKPQTTRDFCTGNSKKILDGDGKAKIESSISHYTDTYKQLDNLDFMKAAKILFFEPRNKKKFGFDFHLVQFIAACLPSLAVYFVAQYARREMKKMDAELEEERKKEKGEKAKQEEEQRAKEENERTKSQNEIAEVKSRLNKLEEAVKQAVESRPRSGDSVTKTREEESIKKRQIEAQEPVDDESKTGKKKR